MEISIAALAGVTAGILAGHWLMDDTHTTCLLDPSLRPHQPDPLPPESPVRVAQSLLEGFVTSRLRAVGRAGFEDECPVHIVSGTLLGWNNSTIPLDEPLGTWTVHYDGSRFATAVTPDGVRLQVPAEISRKNRSGSGEYSLAVVVTADQIHHRVHAKCGTLNAITTFVTSGWGRFKRHRRVANATPGARRIHAGFQYVGRLT